MSWLRTILAIVTLSSPEEWRWWRQWVGGHWESRMYDAGGVHLLWDRQGTCRREVREPCQHGGVTCEDWPVMNRWRAIFAIGRHYQYGRYLARHKWFVFKAARDAGLPWRETWLCALHDLSKLMPDEWGPYSTHFYRADGSKRTTLGKDGFYDDEPDDRAFDRAWLQHIRRNKHHPQRWARVLTVPCGHWPGQVLLNDDGKATCLECNARYPYVILGDGGTETVGLCESVWVALDEMPFAYIAEMLCDWAGAGLAQGTPDTLGWYRARGHRHPLGPRTRAIVESRIGHVRFERQMGAECACCDDVARFPGSMEPPCRSCGHTIGDCNRMPGGIAS